MSSVDARVVFLPRFTTLVGDGEFATAPLDVSRQGGAQFQVWRGPIRVSSGDPTFTLFLEESLDGDKWVLGPSTPKGIPIEIDETRFFSYSFRLRWFRLRVEVDGVDPMVNCWAEGLLRAGDGGAWAKPPVPQVVGLPAGFVEGRAPQVVDPHLLKYERFPISGMPPQPPQDPYAPSPTPVGNYIVYPDGTVEEYIPSPVPDYPGYLVNPGGP